MEAARILVVDDDELTLTVLRKMLEADGYEVDTCSTASEALARCLHASYDLILCDMWMSGLSGKDFYLKIKQGFPEYQRRIVFITGDIASEATWGFIDERRLPYVLKPISRPLLRRKMQEILGAPRESAAGEAGKLPWNGEERRNQPRIAVADTALVRPGDGMPAEDETAVVVNASPAAIYFLSDRDYRVGMRTAVKYPHQGSAGAEREGLVVRVDLHPDGRRGVAVALRGEPGSAAAPGAAPLARAASAALPPEVVAASLARLGLDEEEQARRREEELEELRRVHDQVLDQRDRLAAEEAELRKKLAEMEAARSSMSQTMSSLQAQMEALRKEREQFEAVRHKASHDALTGVWNREAILDQLRRELARAQRERVFVGILLCDLDHFKNINDTYGHLAGDAVLQETTRRIGAAVRAYDSIGRYGGEEFLIILSGCEDDVDIVRRAERIRAQVCAEPVATAEGAIPVTLSVGVASSSEYREVEEVLRAADAALYRAKRGGRNRVEVAGAPEPGTC